MSRRAFRRRDSPILLSAEVAAGKDMRGRESGGCLHAMEKEDLVRGRDEEDTIERPIGQF